MELTQLGVHVHGLTVTSNRFGWWLGKFCALSCPTTNTIRTDSIHLSQAYKLIQKNVCMLYLLCSCHWSCHLCFFAIKRAHPRLCPLLQQPCPMPQQPCQQRPSNRSQGCDQCNSAGASGPHHALDSVAPWAGGKTGRTCLTVCWRSRKLRHSACGSSFDQHQAQI